MLEILGKYSVLFLFLVIAAFLGGVFHEAGHYAVGWGLGWKPVMSFARGGSVKYMQEPSFEGFWSFVSLAAGPIATFLLSWASLQAYRIFPQALLLALALWNALFRLSVIIDGAGSDEAKMSAIVGIPFIFQIASVIASLLLAYFILRSQELVPKVSLLIPVYFVFCAVAYKLSFGICSRLFG